MSAHTPGPFHVHVTVNGAIQIQDESGFIVAKVCKAPRYQDGNADLFAAAPELLDYLNGMLGLVQLVAHRDDLPPAIRDVLTTNHRYVDALAFVDKVPA